MRKAILMVTVIMLSMTMIAGKKPIKYGKIDKSLLEMKTCKIDTTAEAVVICDYGYFNSTSFTFTRILRVKILKEEGKSWGNWKFSTSEKANIRGITYNLVDGEIVEEKLKRSDILTEHILSRYYSQNVAMPDVKVGSVIDIQVSYIGFPNTWYFQRRIPTLRSDLTLETMNYINFRKHFFGYEPLDISEGSHWVALDVPAFKPEPFIDSEENYITKFEFELHSINHPNLHREFTTDWEGVTNRLDEYPYFGGTMKGFNSGIKSWAKEIKSQNLSDEDQIKAAVEKLHSIKYNDIESLFTTEQELSFQYSKNVGNSADINLGLIVMLKKMDFEVYPVAISTRSNGRLSPFYPSLDKLNYPIVMVKLNGEFVLIDATEEFLPYHLLPKRCINQFGRIIHKDTIAPVKLIPNGKDKKVVMYNLELDDDLSLTGTIDNAYYDYAAYDRRKEYSNSVDDDEFIGRMYTNNLYIEEAEVSNATDVYSPFMEKLEVVIDDIVIQGDSMIYLPMMTFEKMESNPFNNEERLYPIDFAYPIERSGTVTITIPEYLEVVEQPKPLMLKMPDKSIDFLYSISNLGDKLVLNYRYKVNKPQINIEEYQNVRTMFEYIIEKESEPVVLKIKG